VGSDTGPNLIDGEPMPFGSYEPWIKPIGFYGRRTETSERYVIRYG
jgi:hypothetical protein